MDFEFLPPAVNSARMYCGPGSGPLLAAAAGWDSLAVELTTAADSYESVLSNLTSLDWQGPAAAAMAATATPYTDWLRQTARLAKQAARQAWAVAAAYEQAWTSTVPPAAIDANRTRQRSLIATNYTGQNTAAIAATEAQYADFWAQDTAAMSGYETSCAAAAAQLTPFPSPTRPPTPRRQPCRSPRWPEPSPTPPQRVRLNRRCLRSGRRDGCPRMDSSPAISPRSTASWRATARSTRPTTWKASPPESSRPRAIWVCCPASALRRRRRSWPPPHSVGPPKEPPSPRALPAARGWVTSARPLAAPARSGRCQCRRAGAHRRPPRSRGLNHWAWWRSREPKKPPSIRAIPGCRGRPSPRARPPGPKYGMRPTVMSRPLAGG